MQNNKRDESKSAKPFRLPKKLLRFVDDFFMGGRKITPAQKKAFAEARKCLFEGIKLKRNNPDSAFFQISRELVDFFDLIEGDASSITMYQRKKFRTAVAIYKELLIGEWERRSEVKTLADLENPVPCTKVAGIIHKRSDNVKRTIENHLYPFAKAGGKYYIEAEHAAIIWPKWKKYLKNH